MLDDLMSQTLDGWYEKIEYSIMYQVHDDACNTLKLTLSIPQLRHYECPCPEVIEKRGERRLQDPLVTQLVEASYRVPQNGDSSGGGGASNKPTSKIPGNLARPDEILHQMWIIASVHCDRWGWDIVATSVRQRNVRMETCLRWLKADSRNRDDDEILALSHDLGRAVHSARVFLGYESDTVLFADNVCGECGGALRVARSLTKSNAVVKCAGTPSAPPCGHSYPWWEWLGMLDDPEPSLVDTATACLHAGISQAKLYRWAHEGRVTRHGGTAKGAALWNLGELPCYTPGTQVTPPPIDKDRLHDRS